MRSFLLLTSIILLSACNDDGSEDAFPASYVYTSKSELGSDIFVLTSTSTYEDLENAQAHLESLLDTVRLTAASSFVQPEFLHGIEEINLLSPSRVELVLFSSLGEPPVEVDYEIRNDEFYVIEPDLFERLYLGIYEDDRISYPYMVFGVIPGPGSSPGPSYGTFIQDVFIDPIDSISIKAAIEEYGYQAGDTMIFYKGAFNYDLN